MSAKMIKCKSCGNEIASNAKTCPNCGAKNSKPIFKKWWFWLIIVLILIIAVSSGGDDTSSDNDSGNQVVDSFEKGDSDNNEKDNNSLTIGQKNALRSAKNYLKTMAFSYEGLIEQLEYEQYSHEDAVYAADNCGANWKEQAAKCAKNYLNTMPFSRQDLIEQLEYEGFSYEEAVYGVEANGY